MEIRNINKNDLELLCVDIITQALADLGQKDNDPENKVMLAQSLAKDLKNRYAFFPMEAVKIAFDNGIRDSELFVLSAANWCKWLNKMKSDIWEGWYNFECGNHHVIQPHIRDIMRKQSTLAVEYGKKRLIN
tara:strand:+ start:125 stop:520 length:396 start_codon:yes stop_codon:yes gene_type:complete